MAPLGGNLSSNLFSMIAFFCAGIALLGGLAVIAPITTIFGIAAIGCAITALVKKEPLSRWALAAGIGGMIVGWLVQAAMFNAVFH
jgi:hypothetical protein